LMLNFVFSHDKCLYLYWMDNQYTTAENDQQSGKIMTTEIF